MLKNVFLRIQYTSAELDGNLSPRGHIYILTKLIVKLAAVAKGYKEEEKELWGKFDKKLTSKERCLLYRNFCDRHRTIHCTYRIYISEFFVLHSLSPFLFYTLVNGQLNRKQSEVAG